MSAAPDQAVSAPPADARVRERIRNDLDTTLIIEAAAGTGKTTALVSRMVAVIASGRAQLDHVVAVTFTEKAAGELKLRLRAEIERARHDPALDADSRERLTYGLKQLEEARIGTIHSFCADLLRERPVEAGVDPMFEVAADDLSGTLFDAAFDRWFDHALQSPGDGLRRVLSRRDLADRDGPRPILRNAAWELIEWRDFDTPWRHEPFNREQFIDELVDRVLAIGELAENGGPDDWLRRALEEIARPIREATRLEGVRGRDYDAVEDALLRLLRGNDGRWRWRGAGDRFGELLRADVIARRDSLKDALVDFRDRAGANLAPILRDELWPIVDYYRELKRSAGRLDFLDLLLTARDLVRDNASARADLQRRFTHIFIDEFQDTDPLQAEIMLLLAADDPDETDWLKVRPVAGKLFIVGDPKQSIYRFRRADVALYQIVKKTLIERGAVLEYLTVSFRAVPEIQSMVNAAFAPLMEAESETQPAYVALQPSREGNGAQPPIVALPVPQPFGDYGRITKWKVEESLPDVVAAFVKWMVYESGWTVTEREAPQQSVPIRSRHICVLFRRLNAYGRDVTRPYVRALEARHVPHVLVRGGSFNEREEVEAIRNALGAIERPDDELVVFATLRGPLFAFSDGDLLEFRASIGSLHPFRKTPADLAPNLKEIASALEVLRELHRGRNRRPLADTIARLLAATRAHAGIAIWPTGEQALANVMRLMDMARRYEMQSGATSLRGFVDYLDERAEREQAGEIPVVEEGTEGVRIMTVHRAKGLEFPVVILADITCNETAREAWRFVDPRQRLCAQRLAGCAPRELLEHGAEELRRDEEEAVRLLYVATTRARDLIVIPVVGDEANNGWAARKEGWLSKLTPVVYPDSRTARAPLAREVSGCPVFGVDSVGFRPQNAVGAIRGVSPGIHLPQSGDHRVVWWDPLKLKLDARETMGLRQFKLLQADEKNERSERGRREYEQWRDRRAEILDRGATPSIRVTTATELAAGKSPMDLPEASQVRIEEIKRVASRPHGARFGTLVHAALSRVELNASRGEVAKAVAFYARMVGAPASEADAAIDAVLAALASPVITNAANSPDVRRENSLLVALEEGMIVEGVADLAFVERSETGNRWVVVDFKTDLEIAGRIDEYRAQVALYMRAINRATGLESRGVILWI